jgi:spore germination cell wall hydrolase CwlJ-like protein
VLSLLLAIAFTFGSTSIYVYADEILAPVEITSTTDIVNESNAIEDTQAEKDKESNIDVNASTNDDNSTSDETSLIIESDVTVNEKIETDIELEVDETVVEDNEDEIEEAEIEEAEIEEADIEEAEIEEAEDNEDEIEEIEEDTSSNKKESTSKKDKDKKAEVKEEPNYSKSDLRLLASLIYAEAGNQSYKGKLAVANVVINRANSKTFWHVDTIKEVIYDSKWGIQFSVTKKNSNGISPLSKALKLYDSKSYPNEAEKKSMNQCIKAAKAALNGENNLGNYLYFSRNSSYLRNKYSNHIVIGDHIFYNT